MNSNKIKNILALSPEEKYTYFIRKCVEFDEVWGLYNEGWATLADNEKNIVIPFWPDESFAGTNCTDKWEKYHPQLIGLNVFVDRWIPGMIKDKRKAGIFYSSEAASNIIINPGQLDADIGFEREN